jgi:hypothetical protein
MGKDGFKTLERGSAVEYELGENESGKTRAINVTASGGADCQAWIPKNPKPESDPKPAEA